MINWKSILDLPCCVRLAFRPRSYIQPCLYAHCKNHFSLASLAKTIELFLVSSLVPSGILIRKKGLVVKMVVVKYPDFDLIIFGAEGCTGRFLVEELVKFRNKNPKEVFTWAVAGRHSYELDDMLEETSRLTGKDFTSVEKIIADAVDLPSLRKMASRCRILINCVGPFGVLGENVIRACLAEGTDLIEAAGEVQYHLKMQLLYSKKAEEKGVFLITACGFASLPADCGTILLQNEFPGDVDAVEIYFDMSKEYFVRERKANYASFLALLGIFSSIKECQDLEKKVLTGTNFIHRYPLKYRGWIHYNLDIGAWCTFNPQCDSCVVRRTQHWFQKSENKRPAQVSQYFKAANFVVGFLSALFMKIFIWLIGFKILHPFMKKHPTLFGFGDGTSQTRISKKHLNSLKFKFIIVGRGWNSKLTGSKDDHPSPPTVTRRVEVSGINPLYGASGSMFLQSALTVLQEREKLPGRGGVLTPGVAFAKTGLIQRLNSNGVEFKVLQEKDCQE